MHSWPAWPGSYTGLLVNSCKNNMGSSKSLCWCFFSPLPPQKSCLLMKFHPWSCKTPLCVCCAKTCRQLRRLQCICNVVFAAGWAAKTSCGPGNSSTQVDPGGFPVPVLVAQARKLFQMVVSCTALLRSHHLAGAWAGAATRAVWQLCLGEEVWRKETFMKMSRLSSLKPSLWKELFPGWHWG